MKKKLISLVLLTILLTTTFSVIPGTYAATEEDIEASIALGLSWLAGQQNVNGYWGSSNRVARTGLAVLKFIDRVNELEDIDSPFDDAYIYKDQVVDGLNYILSQKVTIALSNQTAGDPDSNGNGDGIYFNGHQVYETSVALMALGSAAVYNSTYLPVVQDVTDFLAYAQNEAGDDRGGWGYTANDYQWSDNSVSGYAALGIGYAQQAGAIIPDFVKTELVYWIDFIQMENGGSGYGSSPIGGGYYYNYGDVLLKTGNLLYEMALVGMPVDDPNVTAALTYIEDNWAIGGNLYQRAYCLMKGLEAYGIEDEINVGVSGDWFNETSTFIVNNQNPDGSWPQDSHDLDSPYALTAAWALLTLERAVAIPRISVSIDIKPSSWPNPINKDQNGVTSIAICGTEDFDVMTIDPTSVMLHNETSEDGVSPLRWSYEDVATPYPANPDDPEGHDENGDGYVDLVLKYSTPEYVSALNLCVIDDWEYIKLYLKGNLMEEYGGTPIEGYDWVRIQTSKGTGKK